MTTPTLRASRLALGPGCAARLQASQMRVVVTGAGGWLGRASLEMLEGALGASFDERVHAFGSTSRTLLTRSGREVKIASLQNLRRLSSRPTLLLHFAFVTKDRVADASASDYFRQSEAISAEVIAALPAIGTRRMLFPSSGAVYGQPMRADRTTLEEPSSNPYGTQKLRDERLFSEFCGNLGVRLAIPRIFSLSGPFINKHDAYVLAAVINSVLDGRPIELKSRRRVLRAYIGVGDMLNVALGWLLEDDADELAVFDSGGEVVEIGELASAVLRTLGRADLAVKRPPLDGSPDDLYFGVGTKFAELARRLGVVPAALDRQILDTATYLSETRE